MKPAPSPASKEGVKQEKGRTGTPEPRLARRHVVFPFPDLVGSLGPQPSLVVMPQEQDLITGSSSLSLQGPHPLDLGKQ